MEILNKLKNFATFVHWENCNPTLKNDRHIYLQTKLKEWIILKIIKTRNWNSDISDKSEQIEGMKISGEINFFLFRVLIILGKKIEIEKWKKNET